MCTDLKLIPVTFYFTYDSQITRKVQFKAIKNSPLFSVSACVFSTEPDCLEHWISFAIFFTHAVWKEKWFSGGRTMWPSLLWAKTTARLGVANGHRIRGSITECKFVQQWMWDQESEVLQRSATCWQNGYIAPHRNTIITVARNN